MLIHKIILLELWIETNLEVFDPRSSPREIDLLHIMCGYQCDKAVNKNDIREVI